MEQARKQRQAKVKAAMQKAKSVRNVFAAAAKQGAAGTPQGKGQNTAAAQSKQATKATSRSSSSSSSGASTNTKAATTAQSSSAANEPAQRTPAAQGRPASPTSKVVGTRQGAGGLRHWTQAPRWRRAAHSQSAARLRTPRSERGSPRHHKANGGAGEGGGHSDASVHGRVLDSGSDSDSSNTDSRMAPRQQVSSPANRGRGRTRNRSRSLSRSRSRSRSNSRTDSPRNTARHEMPRNQEQHKPRTRLARPQSASVQRRKAPEASRETRAQRRKSSVRQLIQPSTSLAQRGSTKPRRRPRTAPQRRRETGTNHSGAAAAQDGRAGNAAANARRQRPTTAPIHGRGGVSLKPKGKQWYKPSAASIVAHQHARRVAEHIEANQRSLRARANHEDEAAAQRAIVRTTEHAAIAGAMERQRAEVAAARADSSSSVGTPTPRSGHNWMRSPRAHGTHRKRSPTHLGAHALTMVPETTAAVTSLRRQATSHSPRAEARGYRAGTHSTMSNSTSTNSAGGGLTSKPQSSVNPGGLRIATSTPHPADVLGRSKRSTSSSRTASSATVRARAHGKRDMITPIHDPHRHRRRTLLRKAGDHGSKRALPRAASASSLRSTRSSVHPKSKSSVTVQVVQLRPSGSARRQSSKAPALTANPLLASTIAAPGAVSAVAPDAIGVPARRATHGTPYTPRPASTRARESRDRIGQTGTEATRTLRTTASSATLHAKSLAARRASTKPLRRSNSAAARRWGWQ